MNEREKVIREVFARAKKSDRRVFGYSSDNGRCAEAVRVAPDEWDRICVEGDRRWTSLPPAKEATKGK
jgi:hypothetical protein